MILRSRVLTNSGEIFNKSTAQKLVILSCHSLAASEAFASGFENWYYQHYGPKVCVDLRPVAGMNELIRMLKAQYTQAFKLQWEQTLGNSWSHSIGVDMRESTDSPARNALLCSQVSAAADIVFSGGLQEANLLAKLGFIVARQLPQKHPEWFSAGILARRWAGCTVARSAAPLDRELARYLWDYLQ